MTDGFVRMCRVGVRSVCISCCLTCPASLVAQGSSDPAVQGAVARFQPTAGAIQPYITDFRFLGTFPWDRKLLLPEREKALTQVLDRRVFPSEPDLVASETASLPAGLSWKEAHAGNGQFRLQTVFRQIDYQVAFAETRVLSPADLDAALLAEADDGIRVWLNGEHVFTGAAMRGIQQFKDYTRVHLKKGLNRIVLKLARTRQTDPLDPWNFAVGLRSLEGARAEKAARVLMQELATPVVEEGRSLGLDLSLFETGKPITAELLDRRKSSLRRLSLSGGRRESLAIQDVPSGLNFCLVRESAVPEPFPFFKGDVLAGYLEYRKNSADLLSNPAHQANIGVLMARFDLLLRPEYREDHSYLWQAKIAQLFAEWDSILDAIADRREPYRDVAGLHLRGFRSPIDGQVQNYLLYVPKGYRRGNGPIPLALFVPYVEEPLHPFTMSIPVAEIGNLAMMGRAADENGIAFLWMNNRGSTLGSDFGESDMFRALDEVKRDYAIDTACLYLFGAGTGGRDALALAAKYPDRFAAVGALAPLADFRPQPPLRPTDSYSRLWATQKQPLYTMPSLLHVPVYVLHGDEDFHTPLRTSLALQHAAQRAGIDFHLEVVPGATHLRFPEDPRVAIFRWFRGRLLEENPDDVALLTTQMRYNRAFWVEVERLADTTEPATIRAKYQDGEVLVQASNVDSYRLDCSRLRQKSRQLRVRTNGAVSFEGSIEAQSWITVELKRQTGSKPDLRKAAEMAGPLSDAFTGPVLVVMGTTGDSQHASAVQRSAEQFAASWKERYFVDCLLKKDSELSETDIRDYNLVLFGDAASNRFLARIADRLPFRQNRDGLAGPGKTYAGANFSVQYVYPNPLSPQRYLVLAGNPVCRQCPTDATQLSLKGWYDYAIWRWNREGESPVLEDIGRFDQNWGALVSHFSRVPQ